MDSDIGRELKRGTLEMILLRVLAEREMYGYQLVSTLEQRAGGQFQIKEGTLYPVLYRLEDAGLVAARWETLERGVPRKYYRLTEAGAMRLQGLMNGWRTFVGSIERLLETENRSQ